MRVDFFTIPVQAGAESAEELNRLLSSARILTLDRQFVADGPSSFWSICVVSQTGPMPGPKTPPSKKAQIDYRDVLPPDDFAVYAKLRELRKQLSEREAVPPYAVFTNEQLAAIAQRRVTSVTALKQIDGVGDARVEKYGMSVVALISSLSSVTGAKSDEA